MVCYVAKDNQKKVLWPSANVSFTLVLTVSLWVMQATHQSQWSVKLEKLVHYPAWGLLDDCRSSAKVTKPNDHENPWDLGLKYIDSWGPSQLYIALESLSVRHFYFLKLPRWFWWSASFGNHQSWVMHEQFGEMSQHHWHAQIILN